MLAAIAALISLATVPAISGVTFVSDQDWPESVVQELARGVEAIPANARTFPGGLLELEWHQEPMPFGMGDGSVAHPDWTNGRRRFHLYAYQDATEPRAAFRLEKLALTDRERIWRRRAIVGAILQRWDDAEHWSRTPGWRRINGWLSPMERPFVWKEMALNTYAWAFSRQRGQESAALDLVTFAEEALVPAESLVPGAVPVDDTVRCQEFTKTRFLRGRLGSVGVEEQREAPPARGSCPLFDRWADPDSLDHFEVLFAAPSGRHPAALFGHLLLRPIRRAGPIVAGPSLQPVIEIAAITGQGDNKLQYLTKGLSGGYPLVFRSASLAETLRQNQDIEQRDLRRYALALSPDQNERLLERIWELERRGYFDYYFLTENCASFLAFLLNGVLPDTSEIARPGAFWVMPTSMLDELARIEVSEDGVRRPLLRRLPNDLESSWERALRAEPRRRAALSYILGEVDDALGERWRRLATAAEGSQPEARSAAYQNVQELASLTVVKKPGTREAITDWLHATLEVERCALDEAIEAQHKAEDATVLQWDRAALPTTAELVETRQRLYQHEDPAAIAEYDRQRLRLLAEHWERAPRRPMEPSEQSAVALADQTTSSFTQITEVAADWGEHSVPEGWLSESEARDAALRADDLRSMARSLPGSGAARTALAGGVTWQPGGSAAPTVNLHSSVLSERLGDQRLRGFGADSELRLLEGETWWQPRLGWPTLTRADVAIVGLRTIRRPPEIMRRSLLDWLGWAGAMEYAYRPGTLYSGRMLVGGGPLVMLHQSRRTESFTLLGFGFVTQIGFTFLPGVIDAGPRVELQHRTHLFGAYANAFVVRADYAPLFGMWASRSGGILHLLRGSASLNLQVGTVGNWATLISPTLTVIADNPPGFHPSFAATIDIELL